MEIVYFQFGTPERSSTGEGLWDYNVIRVHAIMSTILQNYGRSVGRQIVTRLCKATVTSDRTISGSYDWLRLGQGATDLQCLLRSPAESNTWYRSTTDVQ